MLSRADDGGDRPAVVGLRDEIGAVRRLEADRSARNRRAARRARAECRRAACAASRRSSVFQPMCGIFSAGSDGAILSTSPRIQPRPSVTTYSRPRSAISCMPTQMPRNGRPLPRTVSSSASTMPGTASSPRRQSAKAPTPGSTTRSARAHLVGIARHHDRLIVPALARGALERLGGRVQIARAVIDDRDAHGRRASWPRLRLGKQADDVGSEAAASRVDGGGGAAAGGGGAGIRRPASKKRRSAASRLWRDHEADVGPAAAQASSAAACRPRSRPAARSATPTANFTSAGDAERPERGLDRRRADEIDHEHQPQPVPEHPQRPEQERPEIKAVAHEREAVGRRDAPRSCAAAAREP